VLKTDEYLTLFIRQLAIKYCSGLHEFICRQLRCLLFAVHLSNLISAGSIPRKANSSLFNMAARIYFAV